MGDELERGEADGRVAEVIDLDGVRIQWGRPRRTVEHCDHRRLLYCQSESRVWCEDCQSSIDGFRAFMMLVRRLEGMLSAVRNKMHKVNEAMTATVVRRAAKHLDQTWGHKMAAACPHCGGGLLPEDFGDGVGASTSRELEIRRRRNNPTSESRWGSRPWTPPA